MSAYITLARHYDALTGDVPYAQWADFLEKLFVRHKTKPGSVLDLACGTGSLAMELAQRGYDMIGADGSAEMLAHALEKAEGMWNKPLFIHQPMTALNLYGTVDACVCSLDSINYLIHKNDLARTFARVSLFLNPGGLFIFDVNTPLKFMSMDGKAYVREGDGVFCVWSAEYSGRSGLCTYTMDLFERTGAGETYTRYGETHKERAYDREELERALSATGMALEKAYGELTLRPPAGDEHRIFYVARKAAQ